MGYIDLHTHSSASDGTLSPGELAEQAAGLGLDAIALTDHDTVSGIGEAVNAAGGTSLEVIPGIELSCLLETADGLKKELHMLGLFVDYRSEVLLQKLIQIREVRDKRNQTMIEHFREDGILLTLEDLTQKNPGTVITRAHFASALLKNGYVTSVDQAFKKYLVYGGRYCPVRKQITPAEAVALIREADGFPALAHPVQYKLGWQATDDLIRDLADHGLMGVEVWHSSHNQSESGRLRTLTRQYGLLPTGGSDFHGLNKPDIRLGTGRGGLRISHLILDDIKKALQR